MVGGCFVHIERGCAGRRIRVIYLYVYEVFIPITRAPSLDLP